MFIWQGAYKQVEWQVEEVGEAGFPWSTEPNAGSKP